MTVTASVIVVTQGRPDDVRRCLTHLMALHTPPLEIVVVDSSHDDGTVRVVRDEFPEAQLRHNELSEGTMAGSRQIGFAAAQGDVVAFVEDVVSAEPDWLEELLKPYAESRVVAVGGRTLNGIAGEEVDGIGEIGRLLPNGNMTGNFAADSGGLIEVDHLLGVNMSFRRTAIEAIGGIRGNYLGELSPHEAADISLRLKKAGGVLMFAPRALVHQIRTPDDVPGERFDHHSLYCSRRNHMMMLVRVFGWRDPMVRHYARTTLQEQRQYFWIARSHMRRRKLDGTVRSLRMRASAVLLLTRVATELAGLIAGVPAAIVAARHDAAANRIARSNASLTGAVSSRGRAR